MRAESAQPAHPQARARRIEGDLLARVDAIGKARLDLGKRDRRGQQDAARRGAAGEFGDREIRLARERGGGIDLRAAAVRQQKRAGRSAAVFGDALRIGEREERPGTRFPSS